MKLITHVAILGIAAVLSAHAAAADHPAGVNVQRWARGEIAVRAIDKGTPLGNESWDITVHPDGSRTIRTTSSDDASHTLHTVVQRADADFRPKELFAQYWVNGAFRNSAFVAVRGPLLDVTSRYDQATTHTVVNMPLRFAFVAQAFASDVWLVAAYDKGRDSPQPVLTYTLDTSMTPPLAFGQSVEHSVAYVGLESVNVPAGTFTCDHFRIGDGLDLYVFGPDRLLVRAVSVPTGTEYVLMKLEQSATAPP